MSFQFGTSRFLRRREKNFDGAEKKGLCQIVFKQRSEKDAGVRVRKILIRYFANRPLYTAIFFLRIGSM